jgi:N-acyl-D-amino-acid deacylase
MLDIAIRGAEIIDGTGSNRFRADLGISGDLIVEIGEVSLARQEISGVDQILSPGFIDPHSHSDWTLHTNPFTQSSVRQGVTTEIVGNCGFSNAPLTELSWKLTEKKLRNYAFEGEINWRTFGEYLSVVEEMGVSTNFVFFLGHNNLRAAVGLFDDEEVTSDHLSAMSNFVAEAMEAGALGLSSGLEFTPGLYAKTQELEHLVKTVGRYGGIYASHVRNRDSEIFASIAEFIKIIRAGGAKGQISHFNVRHDSNAPEKAWEKSVGMMLEARTQGDDIEADTTPFKFGIGEMTAILPRELIKMGSTYIAENLQSASFRKKLRGDCDRYWRFIHKGQWHRVRLENSPNFPEFSGLPMTEISLQMKKDEWECYFDILMAAGEKMDQLIMVGELFTDEHLAEMISHPDFSLGVDGYTSVAEGRLSEITVSEHPYCGHIEYLAHHVRTMKTLSLETAIHKMAGKPAKRFNIKRRGEIKVGNFADLVLFDPLLVRSASTIIKPQVYPEGISLVIVNGEVVVKNGEHLLNKPGRILRTTS